MHRPVLSFIFCCFLVFSPGLMAKSSTNAAETTPKKETLLHKHHLTPKLKLRSRNRSAPVTAFRFFISIFQNVFSPQDGPTCPYRPTCSGYGKQAIRKHGFVTGTFMAADRITRCNPSTEGGYDPVPK